MDIKIMVASHKYYPVPESPCYLPVEVGAALHSKPLAGYQSDAEGINISKKNRNFCELTAFYWAWKNLEADAVGLVHYRRYFGKRKRLGSKISRIAMQSDYEEILGKYSVILPVARNYFIETNYSQYIHAHHKQDLEVTRQVILERCPEYLPAYDHWMNETLGHHFNMFVMKKPLFDHYCEWLFTILFEVERRLDISDYDQYNQRVFGFISERLMDCWLESNHIKAAEMPVIHLDGENWPLKIGRFIYRKFCNSEKMP